MSVSSLARIRRRVGLGFSVLLGSWMLWIQTPGIPVLRAPRASAAVKEAGLTLFEHEWKPGDPLAGGDGLGPVFNERSCVSCHFQGGVGGGGDSTKNVTAFEVHPVPGRPDVKGGVLHRFAISKDCRESQTGLHDFFAVVPGGLKVVGGCFVETRDFDPVRIQSVNTTALFGAGWIDRISTKSILNQSRRRSLQAIGKELLADLDGVPPGRPRVLPDGRIGKFGWKAQFATLEEFVASACANELGLGNPMMEQARPWARHASTKVNPDLDQAQFRSLVAFVDTLPRPTEVLPLDPKEQEQCERGKALFQQIGCTGCHTPVMGGVVGVYSDFLLHRLTNPNELGGGYAEIPSAPLPDDHPLPDEWKTPPLWGVAGSAPYFHDGGSPTLEAAIRRHHGGAASVTKAFESLASADRKAIIGFLESLKPPAETKSAGPRTGGIIAMAR
ncbi:MAG: di-heme oxidoredictase family protein [Isosphaerales bacterium]